LFFQPPASSHLNNSPVLSRSLAFLLFLGVKLAILTSFSYDARSLSILSPARIAESIVREILQSFKA